MNADQETHLSVVIGGFSFREGRFIRAARMRTTVRFMPDAGLRCQPRRFPALIFALAESAALR
jgi:hypothetical protein